METKYSAGITSKLFWGLEAKKTAKFILKGLSRNEIKDIIIGENIYQSPNAERSRRIIGYIYTRLISLGNVLVKILAEADSDGIKVINMISIMLTERLCFEFMYEVYRHKILIGDLNILDKDFNSFFDGKKVQSGEIARWTEKTQAKIRQTIIKMLVEGGFIKIDQNGNRIITRPIVNYNIEVYLKKNGLQNYLYAMTGEM